MKRLKTFVLTVYLVSVLSSMGVADVQKLWIGIDGIT